MKEYLTEIAKKNKLIYNFLKKSGLIFLLSKVYFFKIFDFARKDYCTKNSTRCEYDIKNKHYKYTLLGKDSPTCCLTHLYEIIRDITNVLNEANIDYFIMYGTLLGQMRHSQTFIPWDTDVDIVIMDIDKKKAVKVLSDELSTKYNLLASDAILKINYSKTNHLHADIYFWKEENEVLIDSLNDYWIKNRVKHEDVFPVIFSKLYDLDIKIPHNSEKVLKDIYGQNCLQVALKKYAFKQERAEDFPHGKINLNDLEG